jgi:hypothetical protein
MDVMKKNQNQNQNHNKNHSMDININNKTNNKIIYSKINQSIGAKHLEKYVKILNKKRK